MTNELLPFIKEALTAKVPRPEIAAALKAAGWPDDEIKAALETFADVAFPVPVPKRRPYLSAREAFVYLVLFLGLYLSSWSVGAVVFNVIDRVFPDPLTAYGYVSDSSLRFALSMLIVGFPIFLSLSFATNRWMRQDPDKRSSKIRKWLTYVTLFVAAGVIIGALVSLLYNLLGGELTTRFVLKALTVLAIAGLVFGYYLWDLKQEEKQ